MLLMKPMNLMEAYEKGRFQQEGNEEESPEKILAKALKQKTMNISHLVSV